MYVEKHCLVCGETKTKEIYSGILKKCLSCGFVTANADFSGEDPMKIYSEAYFKGIEYLDYEKEKNALQKNFNKRLNYIFKKANPDNIRSVLEIGCAYGFFAETLTSRLEGIEYTGLDIAEKAIEYGREKLNQNVYFIDYLEYKPKGIYSDVFMWDVIEHLPRPDLFLKKINCELKNGGRLYLTTGNIDALLPKIRRKKWRMIHPPTHIHYFSTKTLTRLLESKGFRIGKITYPWVSRGIKQIYYSLFILKKDPGKLVRKIYKCIPYKLSIPVNTFDIMFVIAIKKEHSFAK